MSASTKPAGVPALDRQPVAHHHRDAGEAERETHPLARADELAEQGPGQRRGEHGLAADDHGGDTGGNALVESPENAAEIGAMEQRRHHRVVDELAPGPRPARAHQHRRHGEQDGDDGEPEEHEGERLRVGQGSCPAEWCKSVALYAAPGG